MALAHVMNAQNLVGIEWRNYVDLIARAPCCGGELLIRTNSAGQVDLRCMSKGCPLSDILHALGLTHEALLPERGPYRPLQWGWWKESPRYAVGPVRPQSEQ
jgi:hypothetical protein